MNLKRNNKSKKLFTRIPEKNKKFKEHAKIRFEFSVCKSLSFENCSRSKIKKVPIVIFLTDQRNVRKIIKKGRRNKKNTKTLFICVYLIDSLI